MLKSFISWLRGLGKIGGFFANILQILTYISPALTVTALLTAMLAMFTSAVHWVQQPAVYATAGIFIFLLWTWIGLVVLRDQREPMSVRISHDYAYALIIDGGWQPIFGKFEPTHPSYPNADAVMMALGFRNVGAGPLRLKVEEFRVVLGGRTFDDPQINPEITFARLSQKGVRSPAIKIDLGEQHHTGTAYCRFLYGPPEGAFQRKYTLRLSINVNIDMASRAINVMDNIIEEKDEVYSSST